MLKFRAADFHKASILLQEIVGHIDGLNAADGKSDPRRLEDVSAKAKEAVVKRLSRLENVSASLHAPVTMDAVRLLKKRLMSSDKETSAEDLKNRLAEINSRMTSELKSVLMLVLKPENQRYFEPEEPIFGQEVESAFPGFVSENISEAGKCLALGRGTAAVFHLMRALEHAVQRLGAKLNVTVIDKNNVDLDWGKIVANMKAPVEAMAKGPEKDKWSEALTLLIHVKQAWRHPTMHPKETYTEEQAKVVLDATGAFMRHLASLV